MNFSQRSPLLWHECCGAAATGMLAHFTIPGLSPKTRPPADLCTGRARRRRLGGPDHSGRPRAPHTRAGGGRPQLRHQRARVLPWREGVEKPRPLPTPQPLVFASDGPSIHTYLHRIRGLGGLYPARLSGGAAPAPAPHQPLPCSAARPLSLEPRSDGLRGRGGEGACVPCRARARAFGLTPPCRKPPQSQPTRAQARAPMRWADIERFPTDAGGQAALGVRFRGIRVLDSEDDSDDHAGGHAAASEQQAPAQAPNAPHGRLLSLFVRPLSLPRCPAALLLLRQAALPRTFLSGEGGGGLG